MIIALLVLSHVALFSIMYRLWYFEHLTGAWSLLVMRYCLMNNCAERFADYAEVWPMRWIVIYFWRWNFRYFIVDQAKAREIAEFFVPTS